MCAVMCLLTRVQYAIRMTLPPQQNSVQIAFGPARRHTSPIFVGIIKLPQPSKEVNDGTFELSRMDAVIRGHVRISQIVDQILHELVQLTMVVHQVIGISEMDAGLMFEEFVVRG